MKIFPAIDILDGRAVRLEKGDRNKATVYYEDPVDAAKLWKSKGAEVLHLVDLDGAFSGSGQNIKKISEIIRVTDLPVQVGGGIRTLDQAEDLFEAGVWRIILGTAAVQDKELLDVLIGKFGEMIVGGIDAKNGFVATHGWVTESELTAFDFCEHLVKKGIRDFVYTDISRDGMLIGPNFEGLKRMCEIKDARIIASGGVSTIEDVIKCKELGSAGAILGAALYKNRINLEEAIKAAV